MFFLNQLVNKMMPLSPNVKEKFFEGDLLQSTILSLPALDMKGLSEFLLFTFLLKDTIFM